MKRVIRFSLNNKLALLILTFIVTVAGIYSGLKMKTEMFPDISVPVVTISTEYPGADPDEVMGKVTKPIEEQIRHLSGVTEVSSSSMENTSQVTIQYDFAKDMVEAEEEVQKEMEDMQFQEDVQTPKVTRINVDAFPILTLSMSDSERSLEDLTALAEEQVVPKLESLDGVSSIQVSGKNHQEVELTYDADKLRDLGLDKEQIKEIIKGSMFSQSLGIRDFDDSEKSLVFDSNIVSLKDLKGMPIPLMDSGKSKVTLDDIADIAVIEKSESISRTNGEDAIGLGIVKAPEANIVEVVNSVKKEMKQFGKENSGLSTTSILDEGKPIEDSVDSMINKVLVGGLFAIIIILLFLRSIRSTLIAVVSIPLSLLMALFLLKQMDISLNLMTLGAMTIAIGRVVDDSIIVIENIYRRLSLSKEKQSAKTVIISATKEMFVPILSSTIVSIAIFLPLGLVEGAIGEMLMPFALTVVFALVASLIVAITVVPMMSHKMMGRKKTHIVSEEKEHGKLASSYKRVLNWSLNHKAITFGSAVGILIASLFLVPVIGFSFLPGQEENEVAMTYNASGDESQSDVVNLAKKAEKEILDSKGVETLQFSVGGESPMQPGKGKQANLNIKYDEDIKNFNQEKKSLIKLLEGLGGKGEWNEQNTGAEGNLGETQMELLVYGSDMQELDPVVSDIMDIMKKKESLNNVDSSISDTFDQYRIVANPEQLSKYGLSARQVANELMPDRKQSALTTVKEGDKELNVYVNDEVNTFHNKEELEDVKLYTTNKKEVNLKDVVNIKEGKTPDTITRRDGRTYASITADVKGDNVKEISSDLEKSVDKLDIPSSVEVSFGGITRQMDDTFMQMGMAMLAAIAIVYFALVLTFGGGLAPFAVLFSMPFAIIGGLVGLFIAGEPLSLTALIGALMLIGIVVTNAIVLIDRAIRNQNDGLSVRGALLEAGGTRLRPILMTAFSTIGALIPLAFGIESDGLISRGLGITVIGGLASSTLLTLVIVPVVYEFLMKFKNNRNKQQVE